MIDPRNNGNIIGNLVADPEIVADGKVARLRIAVDRAGHDRRDDSDSTAGFFNVTYFLNNDNMNAQFVENQIREGNLKKGSGVHIVYRLVQDRWEKDGQTLSAVGLVAEALTYTGLPKSDQQRSETASEPSADVPTEF